ncbi:MAG: dTMP kinase [Thermoplasmata archaeon]
MNATRRRGRLVVLEGIDGTGKSTLQRSLARRWRAEGWRVDCAHEPNDPRLGRMAQAAGVTDPWASALLFTADRLAALPRLESALARTDIVLMDRSFFSTLAYQGSLLPPAERRALARLQRHVTLLPDRVVLLDLPASEALRRIGHRGRSREPLERRRTLGRVARAYRAMARPPRWVVLDATFPPAECAQRAHARLRRWLGRPPHGRTAAKII